MVQIITKVNLVKDVLLLSNLKLNIMVDCSGNSNKDYKNQPKVFNYLVDQISEDSKFITE